MNESTVSYHCHGASAAHEATLRLFIQLTGYRAVESAGGDCDVYYGAGGTELSTSARLSLIRESQHCTDHSANDIIDLATAHLTDTIAAAAPADAFDQHGRLKYSYYRTNASIVSSTSEFAAPVNQSLREFQRLLRERCDKAPRPIWPNGAKAAIGLSHDVDWPQKFAALTGPLLFANASTRDFALTQLKRIRTAALALTDGPRDDYWLFDQILTEERRRGFTSTFFFCAANQFSSYGSHLDVAYDIADARFTPVFSRLREDGWDIGLHASYHATLEPDGAPAPHQRLQAERDRLQKISGADIRGIRHHYWRAGAGAALEHTLRAHETAGFDFDSSLAFNDATGLRRGAALPFYPWLDSQNRQSRVLQLPMFLMDGNIFYGDGTIDQAVATVERFLSAVGDSGGVGVIDWHVRTAAPVNRRFKKWGQGYLAILDLLSQRSDIWTTDLASIYRRLADSPLGAQNTAV